MHMIQPTNDEINRFINQFQSYGSQNDSDGLMRTEMLQDFYNSLVDKYIQELREHNNGYATFVDKNGNQLQGVFIKNGTQKKRISLNDCTIHIRLRQIRCTELHMCSTIFISLLIPGSSYLTIDLADVILSESVNEVLDHSTNPDITPRIIRYTRKKWIETWRNIVESDLHLQLRKREDVLEISDQCLKTLNRQFFQNRRTPLFLVSAEAA